MKEELKRKFEVYRARWAGGTKAGAYFLLIVIFSIFFHVIFMYIPQYLPLVDIIAFLVITVSFGVAVAKTKTQPYEEMVFGKLCETLQNLDYYLVDQSKIHLNNANKKLRAAVKNIRYIEPSKSRSVIIKRDIIEPLKRLEDNIKNKIVPRVLRGDFEEVKKVYKVIEGMALRFSEPNLQNINDCNEELESLTGFETVGIGIKERLSGFGKTRIGQFSISIIGGYFLIVAFSAIYCYSVNLDFTMFARNNPYVILGGGAVLSAGILAFIKK